MTHAPFTLDTEAVPPPQQTSAAFRVVLRALGLPMMWPLQVAAALSRRFGAHRLSGKCQGSGGCCHYISLDWPSSLRDWTRLRRAFLWWYQQVHGFFPRRFAWVGDHEEIDVFGCRHLRADNRCAEYRLRPLVCRLWPNPLGDEPPVLKKGCGYQSGAAARGLPSSAATAPTTTTSTEALDHQGVSPARLVPGPKGLWWVDGKEARQFASARFRSGIPPT